VGTKWGPSCQQFRERKAHARSDLLEKFREPMRICCHSGCWMFWQVRAFQKIWFILVFRYFELFVGGVRIKLILELNQQRNTSRQLWCRAPWRKSGSDAHCRARILKASACPPKTSATVRINVQSWNCFCQRARASSSQVLVVYLLPFCTVWRKSGIEAYRLLPLVLSRILKASAFLSANNPRPYLNPIVELFLTLGNHFFASIVFR